LGCILGELFANSTGHPANSQDELPRVPGMRDKKKKKNAKICRRIAKSVSRFGNGGGIGSLDPVAAVLDHPFRHAKSPLLAGWPGEFAKKSPKMQ
jgi:hypothetical protein